MKKRILSMLLAIVMVCSLLPTVVFAADSHAHCICGETHASVGDHDAEVSTTFTAVTNEAELQNAATNGGNVYLANDIELTAVITVAGNLNLCLNGYSITPADSLTDSRAITVNSGATFVLTDCGDGSIRGFTTSSHINGVGVYNEGTFTMYAGAISDIISNGHGGGVYNKGTFTMYGGTIRNNELTAGAWYGSGAGVYQRAGSFTMYGGTITGNKTISTGGGVYYSGGTFTMHGGTIGENCADSGGGVYGNYFAMHGGSVINNTATTYGGGIYNYNGTLELSGNVTITGNEVNEEQSDICLGYTVITIKDDFTPTSVIGVTKRDVVGTIVRAADGETLDIENYKQYFVGEEGIPVYAADNALELGYTITEEPDDTNDYTVKTNSDANASYQWAKYGLIAHSVVYESYGPMSLRSVTPMPGMEDVFGIKAALVNDCGYSSDDYWDYYPNYDVENKYWIASNNIAYDGDARDCSHNFDASYFCIFPKKAGTLTVTLIDPLDDGEELALYIMDGEGQDWLVEEVTPNADGSYSLDVLSEDVDIAYRLLIKDSDDTNNGTYEEGFNETFPKLTATFNAMGASELLDGQDEATLYTDGLTSGVYACRVMWDIYETPVDTSDDYTLTSASVEYAAPVYFDPAYPVVENKGEDPDGTVKLSSNYSTPGSTVTVTVTPDKYYGVEKVIVRDASGKEIPTTKNADGTYSFTMPYGKVTVEAVYVWENPFVDVAEGTFYIDAVEWALKNGITEGTSETTFSPIASCTRAQMVTFLWRAAGSPEPTATACPFTDVDMDSYYGKAVLWAVENGITNGTSETAFSPDMECSRAQMAAFLCCMADGKAASNESTFVDVEDDAYYAESVQWAVENGVTEGTGNNMYGPDAVCTRGQMVTFLYRYYVK